jgi:THO complex subunit 4
MTSKYVPPTSPGASPGASLVLTRTLKDLFEPFGDIKKSFVNYDKSGRSNGTATVIFARRASALEAIKKYNNVPLDGQAMKISLVATTGGGGGGGGGGGRVRAARADDDGGVRSFRKAVNDAESFTIRVGGGNRGVRQGYENSLLVFLSL